jgi:putative hydrolase
MKFLLDVHTHTTASCHAYSSLQENIQAAKSKGLSLYGVSDHGPMMPGAPQIYYYQNIRVLPRMIEGIRVLRGVEANIIDSKGTIDMSPDTLTYIDYVIASCHVPCIEAASIEKNTEAIIMAMQHPRVNIIGHPDDDRFPIDYERIVWAAKEYKVLLEVNNASLSPTGFRQNAKENIIKMLKLCMENEVSIIVNSDAHVSYDIGVFNFAEEILTELNFPQHLIMNLNPEGFLEFIHYAE